MTPNLIIRKANFKDSDSIAYVHFQSWQETYRNLIDLSYLDSLTFEKQLEKRHSIFSNENTDTLIAEVDEKIVGFCDTRSSFYGDGQGELHTLYLLQSHQRKGIGAKLFQEAVQLLRQKGYRYVYIWVLATNQKARAFYEKQGADATDQQYHKIGNKDYLEIKYTLKIAD